MDIWDPFSSRLFWSMQIASIQRIRTALLWRNVRNAAKRLTVIWSHSHWREYLPCHLDYPNSTTKLRILYRCRVVQHVGCIWQGPRPSQMVIHKLNEVNTATTRGERSLQIKWPNWHIAFIVGVLCQAAACRHCRCCDKRINDLGGLNQCMLNGMEYVWFFTIISRWRTSIASVHWHVQWPIKSSPSSQGTILIMVAPTDL
jgi:hypothetical protein